MESAQAIVVASVAAAALAEIERRQETCEDSARMRMRIADVSSWRLR
jgi:hypothetical protein